MAKSIRDTILNANDRPREPVPTPEWEGTDGLVFAQCLSGDERDAYETFMSRNIERDGDDYVPRAGTRGTRAYLVSLGAVDADGDPIFNETDVAMLWCHLTPKPTMPVSAVQRNASLPDCPTTTEPSAETPYT